jgi:hypothetical protein
MGVRTVLLCVALVIVTASCDGATLWDEARPAVRTDLELTASDSDTGNWTANLGDMEVQDRAASSMLHLCVLLTVVNRQVQP